MGFFLLGPLVGVPPLAATLAYDTGVPVSAESARTVLSGLATSSCPLRRRQAVQGAEPLVSFRRGPSAWQHCKNCMSCSSARGSLWITIHAGEDLRVALLRIFISGQPLDYNSRRRRPARRTVRVSANISRTWSSGSASLYTAAWSAQGSDTWCIVSPVRQNGVNGVAPSHTSLGSSVASRQILTAREGSCLWLLSLTTPATRCPPASRSCLTSLSSSPPMGMGPTTPSTTGRGIRAPMGIPPAACPGVPACSAGPQWRIQ